jgi:tetratricopeptide (TPR) repeat protein
MKKNQTIFLQSLIISLLLCFLCGNTSAETRQYHFKPIDKAFDDIAKRLDQIDFDNKRTIVKPQWLDSLDKIAAQRNNKQLQARALYWRVRMSQMAAPPPECIKMLEKARRLCDKSYEYDLACIEYQLAGNYERMSQYIKTYTLLRKAIKTFENENDYYFLGNAHLLLTQIFMDITNPDQAKEELKLCKEAYLKDNYPLNRVYFFEAMLTNGSKSLSLYQKSIDTGAKDWGMTLQAYVYISDYYLEHSMPDNAMEYCNKAEILLNKVRYCSTKPQIKAILCSPQSSRLRW